MELVDTALPIKLVSELRSAILHTDGVSGLHRLRTRRMGPSALADVHIMVSPRISVSEGHLIADKVRNKLRDEFEELSDVLVHIDPEDDDAAEQSDRCQPLPQRSTILHSINEQINQLSWPKKIETIQLHYLKGHVEVELILARSEMLANSEQQNQAEERLRSMVKQINFVSVVSIYYR
jgi:hypothetical protein